MVYIDKELFKQDIKMRYCNNCARPNEIKCRACHIDDMLGEIEDAPTADVVEVVRCKDCRSFNKHYKECTLHGSHFGENGFCCKGKRKTDGKDTNVSTK